MRRAVSYLVSMPLDGEATYTVMVDALAEETPTDTLLEPTRPGQAAAKHLTSLDKLLSKVIESVASATFGVEAETTEVALECWLRVGGEGAGVILTRGPSDAHFRLTVTNRRT